jgi:cyclopropane fatty-acyl-phospholipid synthase-like methyltransferase
MKYLIFLLPALYLFSCQNSTDTSNHQEMDHEHQGHQHQHQHGHHHNAANELMNQRSFEEQVASLESPERAAWQQPDTLLAYLGDLQGIKVMDLGAGTGYFSFRLAAAGAQVIAADVDDRFQQFIERHRDELGIPSTQLQTRKTDYDDPLLTPGEVDMVFSVNVYHHIEDRSTYFQKVKAGLAENGRLVLVDFKLEETEHGPPVSMRIGPDTVQEELKKAGFQSFELQTDLLPEQYILTAR